MSTILRDRLLFLILLVIGLGWVIVSATTIPNGYSGSHISPKTFPTTLGILLSGLALMGLLGAERKHRKEKIVEAANNAGIAQEVWAAAATFGFLVLYVVAMYVLGFTLATILAVAVFLGTVLKERSPIVVGAMSVGLGFGLYLLMSRLLGVYLPAGVLGLGI